MVDQDDARPVSPILADALAGGLACGAMDVMFVADVLKVRRTHARPRRGVRCRRRLPKRQRVVALFLLFKLTAAARHVSQVRAQSGVPLLRGGFRGLFAGAGSSVFLRAAHGFAYLPLYVAVKHALQDKALAEPLAVAAAAAAAVTATALVELPLEALMLRVKAGGTTSLASAARAALASPAGLAGLWAGAAPYGASGRGLALGSRLGC